MSLAGKIALGLFIPSFIIGSVVYGLYFVHTRGIMEVRVPKPLRLFCLKDYLSPEEKEEIRLQEIKRKMAERHREIIKRAKLKPNLKGFIPEDSFFKEEEIDEEYTEKIDFKQKT